MCPQNGTRSSQAHMCVHVQNLCVSVPMQLNFTVHKAVHRGTCHWQTDAHFRS